MTSPQGPIRRTRELASAFALFAATALALLWPAIADWSSVSYTSADLVQSFTLTSAAGPIQPGNVQLSDPVVEMLPWLDFDARELASGRLPTWNPWNGGGVPHLANFQSAAFSPFSLFFYAAPLKWALFLSAFAKLVLLGTFTFLFVRALGAGFLAACAGGVIYQLGGHNLLLLAYPHSSVAAFFPAALWAIERGWQAALTDFESPLSRALPWACALAVFTAALLFAGSPETAAFAVLVAALYACVRGVRAARGPADPAPEPRAAPARRRASLRALALLGAACVLGLALSAVQVLPFLEYASRSALIDSRGEGFDGLRSANWPLQFFPGLFGSPWQSWYPRHDLPAPNYEAANTSYFGPLAWLLAIFAVAALPRRFAVRFFAVLTAAWILCAYDFEWMRPLMVAFQSLTHAPFNRSQLVPLFSLAVLASFGIDAWTRREGGRGWVAAAGACALAALALWLAHRGADQLVRASFVPNVPRGHALWVPPHVAFASWTFAAGTAAFAWLALARSRALRSAAAVLILGALFAQSGWLLRGFNPVSRDEHVFPRTSDIERLARHVGRERLQVIGEDTLPPHVNMTYEIATIAVYDGLWIREYDRLHRALFGPSGNWRDTFETSAHALTQLGVRYVLARDDWPRLEPGIAIDATVERPRPRPLPLAGGTLLEQTFRAHGDGLDRVCVALGAQDDPVPAFAELSLEDAATGEVLARRRVDTHAVRGSLTRRTLTLFPRELKFNVPTGWVQLELASPARSAGREYRLKLAAEPGGWKNGFVAWTTGDEAPEERKLSVGGEVQDARLCFDWSANVSRDLEVVERFDPFTLYRFRRSPGRFWLVSEARLAPDADSALAMTVARDHDPADVVILEGVGDSELRNSGTLAGAPAPELTSETSRGFVLRTDAPRDTWMVAALSWYPGWTARVDGRTVPLAKANYAFMAVPVPAGRHEVELAFESASTAFGAWISIASALVLAAFSIRALHARKGASLAPARVSTTTFGPGNQC